MWEHCLELAHLSQTQLLEETYTPSNLMIVNERISSANLIACIPMLATAYDCTQIDEPL